MREKPQIAPTDEWESMIFPIRISKLKFENDIDGFPDDTVVEIWRADDYRLTGRMLGSQFYAQASDRVTYVGKGHIVKNENMIGFDANGNKWTIMNCLVLNLDRPESMALSSTFQQSADIRFDFVKFSVVNGTGISLKPTKRFDWFLTKKVDVLFDGSTFRKENPRAKARRGLDNYENEENKQPPYSVDRDYIVLKQENGDCLIAKVPEKYLQKNFNGICFEYRENRITTVTQSFVENLKNLTSFLIGSKLYYVGYTILSGNTVVESYLTSPRLNRNLRGGQPPVPSNYNYQWSNFAYLVNSLFPRYNELEKSLQLNHALSRYWTAEHSSIGLNLPVLASAFEIIAANFLKVAGVTDLNYVSEQDFKKLLGNEFEVIRKRILQVEGGEILLNKILGSFRKGPNEKMRKFFSLLELKLGKDEKEALSLRNKMAHSARDYSDEKRAHDDLNMTRVYEMLFNRTLLKILGYSEFYCDYSLIEMPMKQLSVPSGEKR